MSLERLREELLYVVVFGSRYGESVVVRVPGEEGARWMVVDSCRSPEDGDEPPALRLLRSYGDAAGALALDVLVLSHCHEDHCRGFDVLLEHAGPSCAVRLVDRDRAKLLKRVPALAAVFDAWLRGGGAAAGGMLRAGGSFEVGALRCDVLWPPDEVTAGGNESCAPLWLRWGELRVLLGADLEFVRWGQVEHQESLDAHAMLKVPHHGSTRVAGQADEAVHTRWAGEAACSERAWVLTPYRRGETRLPRVEAERGLGLMLRHVSRVMMTALPQRVEGQSAFAPGYTTRAELESASRDAQAAVVRERHGRYGGGQVSAPKEEIRLGRDTLWGEAAASLDDDI